MTERLNNHHHRDIPSLLSPVFIVLPRMRWSDSIADSIDMNLSKLWEIVEDREPGVLSVTVHWVTNSTLGPKA